ncbi:RutC family protein [Paramyrothecium foliicola]|nr:RutC family protein [Paramyrothecium foliicola]
MPVQFINPPGPNEDHLSREHYSLAVNKGNGFWMISGQGGWDPVTIKISPDPEEEVRMLMKNIDDALQSVGLRGWEDVFYFRVYCTELETMLPRIGAAIKKRIPHIRPGAVALGVTKLAHEGMTVEIEVEAYSQDD